MAYSVITPDGTLRAASPLGIARTLAVARHVARAGDTIVQWTNSGSPRNSWAVMANGKLQKRANARGR